MNRTISIDDLIGIVKGGGKVQTGVDVYNDKGILLLQKNILVDKPRVLEIIKESGINSVMVNPAMNGGLWDASGKQIPYGVSDAMPEFRKADPESSKNGKKDPVGDDPAQDFPDMGGKPLETRLREIEEIKQQAAQKYEEAKKSIQKVLTDIKATGGQFDFDEVEHNVAGLVDFLVKSDNPFSYLTQEMFSYDSYLYNHSINVCSIGTAIAHRFNNHFSGLVDDFIKGNTSNIVNPFEIEDSDRSSSFICFYPEDLKDISLGFFLHDIGKIMVEDKILNKEGPLTPTEFEEVRRHSYDYGMQLLEKNQLRNSVVRNIIRYHHAPLFGSEDRCYPMEKPHVEIPLYVRICKLADIYDAMTSKRCYKDAVNPINVVTQVFRSYAKKDLMLQYILHAFVKSIGIYPPGSIVYLKNGQMAYVLESTGPLLIPFSNERQEPLSSMPDPIDVGLLKPKDTKRVDDQRSVKTPVDVFPLLPSYIRSIIGHP